MDTELNKNLKRLSANIERTNSFTQSFLRGLITGIGTAIGATVIAGALIAITAAAFNFAGGAEIFKRLTGN